MRPRGLRDGHLVVTAEEAPSARTFDSGGIGFLELTAFGTVPEAGRELVWVPGVPLASLQRPLSQHAALSCCGAGAAGRTCPGRGRMNSPEVATPLTLPRHLPGPQSFRIFYFFIYLHFKDLKSWTLKSKVAGG